MKGGFSLLLKTLLGKAGFGIGNCFFTSLNSAPGVRLGGGVVLKEFGRGLGGGILAAEVRGMGISVPDVTFMLVGKSLEISS